jgi:hypothetical protein
VKRALPKSKRFSLHDCRNSHNAVGTATIFT